MANKTEIKLKNLFVIEIEESFRFITGNDLTINDFFLLFPFDAKVCMLEVGSWRSHLFGKM